MKIFSRSLGFVLMFQTVFCLIAQTADMTPKPELKIEMKNGELNVYVKLNEPFRWEKTKFQSIKTFPMRGGAEIPHLINFREKGSVTWRQTDVVFEGSYKLIEITARDILNQYKEKYGGIGIRTWSLDKSEKLRSFNEITGAYEYLTPKEFAKKFNLNFEQDNNKIEASIAGYLLKIVGIFNPEKNVLSFDNEDYSPIFTVPKFILEQSDDMEIWSKAKISHAFPKEYNWPKEILNKLQISEKGNTFYRIKIENN